MGEKNLTSILQTAISQDRTQNAYLAEERGFKDTIDNGYEYALAIHLSLIFLVG